MIKTYQATEKTLTARPRSKRLRESGISSGTSQGASVVSASMETLWSRISETLEDGSISEHIETQLPAQVAKSLTLVDEATGKKITLSIVNGHVYVDGAIIAQSDVVAYGAEGTQVTTVEDLIAQQIQINPTETATATATKIKVNGVVYTIQGGGGSGGGISWGGTSGSGNAVTAMNYDSESNTLSATKGATFTSAGTLANVSDTDAFFSAMASNPSMLGSVYVGSYWYNFISSRHRNGANDGNKFGLVFFTKHMTGANPALYLRTHTNGNWGTERQIAVISDLTKANVGLGNVDNTADADKSVAVAKKLKTSNFEIYEYTDGSLRVAHCEDTTVTNQIFITSAGRVGVGVASPTTALDVNGQIRGRGRGMMDGIDLNNQTITRAKSIALVSPDGTKTRTLAVDNNGNLTVDGNIYATGSLTTLA